MKIEQVSVTPKMAREWLRLNTINRPLVRQVVENFKTALERGEYAETHQGIAFGDSGRLLDGQHRLTAISEMPDGFSLRMVIAHGVADDAFKAMDLGRKRTQADVLRENRRLVEVARFLAVIYSGRPSAITPTYLIQFVDFVRQHHTDLIDFCPGVSKVWASASVRAAAVMSMASGVDADYVKIVYRALVTADYASLPNSGHVLYRAFQAGTIRAGGGTDLFCRCMRVFRPENAGLKVVKVMDAGAVVGKVRAFLQEEMFDAPKKKAATVIVAAKAFKPANYRIAGI